MKSKTTPIVLLLIAYIAVGLVTPLHAQGFIDAQAFAFAMPSTEELSASSMAAEPAAAASSTQLQAQPQAAIPTELMMRAKSTVPALDNKKGPLPYDVPMDDVTKVAELRCDYHEQRVRLSWVTPCEHNISQFIVKRTTDGVNFVKVGLVPSQGNSLTPQSYELADADPVNGSAYYCLFSKDIHDKTTCWGFVESELREKSVLHIAANPGTQENMHLEMNFLSGESVDWILLDTDGNLVDQGSNCPVREGAFQMRMNDLPQLQPGLYFLQIQNEKDRFTHKIVIAGHE